MHHFTNLKGSPLPYLLGLLLASFVLLYACGEDAGSTAIAHAAMAPRNDGAQAQVGQQTGRVAGPDSSQISEYVRRIFQDSRGHLWFGTNSDGVCRYDGERLTYFSTSEGLAGNGVTGIMEDRKGNMWFSTSGGLSKYDGRSFTTYTTKDGLGADGVSCLLEDHNGVIWLGTWEGGVCRFDPSAELRTDGMTFTAFPIPVFDIHKPDPTIDFHHVAAMVEDAQGNMWFGSLGMGVCKYDPSAALRTGGKTFTRYTTADGLCDDQLVCIVQDMKGNMWFSSMFGGLSRFDPSALPTGQAGALRTGGRSFTNYSTANGAIGNDEVWTMRGDSRGNVWFSSEGYGVYRYDPQAMLRSNLEARPFTNYAKKEGLGVMAVQAIMEDTEGRIWVGGGGGLYRLEGDRFINVRRNGPWPVL